MLDHYFPVSKARMFIEIDSGIGTVLPSEEVFELLDDLITPPDDGHTHDPFTGILRAKLYNFISSNYDLVDIANRDQMGITLPLLAKDAIESKESYSGTKVKADPRLRTDRIDDWNICYDTLDKLKLCSLLSVAGPASVGIEYKSRFSHHWIVAPPDTGKSTLLANLIRKDFEDVKNDKASVILMESNVDLVKSVSRYKEFAKGGELEGRLVLIDVEDIVEHPIALNLFDLGYGDIDSLSPVERAAMINITREMIKYVFRLIGADFTPKQESLFERLIALLLTIKDANLDMMTDFLEHGPSNFLDDIAKLPERQRAFWGTYNDQYKKTAGELLARVYKLTNNDTLASLFTAKETKVNFYEAMSQSKVVLINTSVGFLGDDGAEVFGRFMIALVMAAAQRRLFDEKASRKDTFFYIDEAHTYIAKDTKLPRMLAEARKLRLGLILAHQDLHRVQAVAPSLMSMTAIKMVGMVSIDDGKKFGGNMNIPADVFPSLPMHSFAISSKQKTTFNSMIWSPEPFTFDDKSMSDDEFEELLIENRKSFAYTLETYTGPQLVQSNTGENPLDGDDDFLD